MTKNPLDVLSLINDEIGTHFVYVSQQADEDFWMGYEEDPDTNTESGENANE